MRYKLRPEERLRIQDRLNYTEDQLKILKSVKELGLCGRKICVITEEESTRLYTIEGIDRQVMKAVLPNAVIYYIEFIDDKPSIARTCTYLILEHD